MALYFNGKKIIDAERLSNLSDVSIISPTDNQVLKYNSAIQSWENGPVSITLTFQFNVTATHPNNPTAYSITVVDDNNVTVFSKNYQTSGGDAVYGVFPETTDTFVYKSEIFTVVAQGFKAVRDQKMLDFSINGVSHTVYCSQTNSSYATTDTFAIIVAKDFNASDVAYNNTDSGLVADNVQDAIDELSNKTFWTDLTGTLTTGQTSIILQDAVITTNSTVDVYVNDAFYGVNPTSISLSTGSITLVFPEQSTDMPVKVRIS